MRIRSFKVPFAKVVDEDAHEIEFGPDDYMVVRPLFGLPANELTELGTRIEKVGEADDDALAVALVMDVLGQAILEWSLKDAEGVSIAKPKSADDLRALPGALAGSIYQFLMSYRGEGENPTTRG